MPSNLRTKTRPWNIVNWVRYHCLLHTSSSVWTLRKDSRGLSKPFRSCTVDVHRGQIRKVNTGTKICGKTKSKIYMLLMRDRCLYLHSGDAWFESGSGHRIAYVRFMRFTAVTMKNAVFTFLRNVGSYKNRTV
jgi:hypothetical protein